MRKQSENAKECDVDSAGKTKKAKRKERRRKGKKAEGRQGKRRKAEGREKRSQGSAATSLYPRGVPETPRVPHLPK
jgi:hypothetical protein